MLYRVFYFNPMQFRRSKKRKNVKFARNREIEKLRRQRKYKTYTQLFQGLRKRAVGLGKIVVIVLVAVTFVLAVSFFFRNEYYSIKAIEFFGNERIPTSEISSFLDRYKNRNLVSVTKWEVYNDLVENFLEVSDINIVKIYPDELMVEIVESQPVAVLYSFSSARLLSIDGEVVGHLDIQPFDLTEAEEDIVETGGNPDADYVRVRMQNEAEGAFKWDEVPTEERQATLQRIKDEISVNTSSYINQTYDQIMNSSFNDLPVLYAEKFSEVDLDASDLQFCLNIFEFFEKENLGIKRIKVLNIYDYGFELNDNKNVMFTTRRSDSDQLRDFETILLNNQFGTGTIFDLRSVHYSIR